MTLVDNELDETSLLDVIDNVLNHGVVLHGELVLGVANVDLIYAKLSVLLAALDKVATHQAMRAARGEPGRPRRKQPTKSRSTSA